VFKVCTFALLVAIYKFSRTIKMYCHTSTLKPITKHLVAKDTNKLCLSIDEWKFTQTLSSLMDEWKIMQH
jgi:hypothetical protein